MEIGVLGPLEVKAFGQEVDLGGREAVVLSALALRAGQVVSTDTLMERLWGEAPPPTAPKALQNVIVRLRKRLQPDRSSPSVLLTRGSGYVLDVPRRRVDAHRFMDDLRAARAHRESGDATAARASADAALALWRAPQLPDLGVSIEATVDAEHLYTARLEALEIRIDADLMLGRHESIVAELEELVRAHPFGGNAAVTRFFGYEHRPDHSGGLLGALRQVDGCAGGPMSGKVPVRPSPIQLTTQFASVGYGFRELDMGPGGPTTVRGQFRYWSVGDVPTP